MVRRSISVICDTPQASFWINKISEGGKTHDCETGLFGIELPATSGHCRDLTERFLKAT